MSDEATDKFQDALAEFVKDRYGNGMVTNYFVIAEFIDEDGDVAWLTKSPEHQSLATTLGLIEWVRLDLQLQSEIALRKLYYDEDEEDGD